MQKGPLQRYAAISASSLLGMTILAGCGKTQAKKAVAVPPLPVTVQVVKESALPTGSAYLGTITPFIQTNVSPAISGVLSSVAVRPGDQVQVGQVLASINTSLLKPQLAEAQANLAKTLAPPTSATVAAAQSNVSKAQAALQSAEQLYQDAQAIYNDRNAAKQTLVAAQNTVKADQASLQEAQANYSKAELAAKASLSGGGTPQDLASLQSIVAADQKVVADAETQLTAAQNNAAVLSQNLANDQSEYGSITESQVNAAYQSYQSALQFYQSWQDAANAGTNPYTSSLNAAQNIYNNLNSGYQTLQTAIQQNNQGQTTLAAAQTTLANAQSALAAAEKNLSDAAPGGNTNLAQQAQANVAGAKAALDLAQAQYQGAESNLKIVQALYNDRTQAKEALHTAQGAMEQDKAALQNAEAALQQTLAPPTEPTVKAAQAQVQVVEAQIQDGKILSPIAGVIQSVSAQVGQSVGPGSGFIQIAATSPVMATINVPAFEIGNIQTGITMNVTIPTLNKTFQGNVLDIEPELGSSTDAYPVQVVLSDSQSILPGLPVQATVVNGATANAILVPADAVVTLQGGAEEVFLDKNGVAEPQIVQLGVLTDNQYQITSGIKVGDTVIVAGQNLLSPGDRVRVVPSSPSGTANPSASASPSPSQGKGA